MRDLIGAGSDDRRFAAFLADWRARLDARIAGTGADLATVDGLAGAVLAGSHGRGAGWPLSDIDLVLVTRPGSTASVLADLDKVREPLLERWAAEGWWTGIDAGRLVFDIGEVEAVTAGRIDPDAWLADPRWFHALDKAWGGRALLDDADGRAAVLARWATR